METARILIVEDEAVVALDLKMRLSRLGYGITGTAAFGTQAIDLAAADPPDLILMDINIKGEINGIETARRIILQRSVPIVFLTAHADQETLAQAKAANPYGYLVKPFEEKSLQTTIEMAVYKHRMERQLQQEEHKLRTSQAEQERLQVQLLLQAQKMEAVGQLAGGVAHEFNNMLGVILGYVEMAMEQIDAHHPISADLQEIQKAAQRSADITRQLLAFARKQTVVPKVLDLNATIEGMLKPLRRLIGEDIDLVWLPGTGLWHVKIDPSQIDQILANLFVNAREAIAGVGKLTVETGNNTFNEEYCDAHAGFVPGEYVRIVVSDNGCGMDKETLAHIFEPFFTTKGVGEGTGLGLATVYGAIRQNNGFIDVCSEPGKSTTFTIYLPRHVGNAVRVTTVNSTGHAKHGVETILLVEDEPTILAMTKRMLQMLGYRVLTAGNPREAMRMAGEYAKEIHLLLTDVVMPELNGQDLAGTLLSKYPHLKCLFMSGYTADIIAQQGILVDGVQFIQKPFSIKDLADKVGMVLCHNNRP
jgi:signal transduction histidine kinase